MNKFIITIALIVLTSASIYSQPNPPSPSTLPVVTLNGVVSNSVLATVITLPTYRFVRLRPTAGGLAVLGRVSPGLTIPYTRVSELITIPTYLYATNILTGTLVNDVESSTTRITLSIRQ